MNGRPRFVLDTNVLVDTICFDRSFGFRAFELALTHGEVMLSPEAFGELLNVMMRARFDRFLPMKERLDALAMIARLASWMNPWCQYQACRDPTDDKYLSLAVCAAASMIITRDNDLLDMGSFNGIGIVSPQSFVEASRV